MKQDLGGELRFRGKFLALIRQTWGDAEKKAWVELAMGYEDDKGRQVLSYALSPAELFW